MKLSKNFSLEELIRSDTAERLGIDNIPKDEKVIENLRNLCFEVLQPLRDYVGAPVVINSGYRCPKLNEAVGGVKTSQHCSGEACDIRLTSSKQGREWAAWIEDNCRFDQMLLERNKSGAVYTALVWNSKLYLGTNMGLLRESDDPDSRIFFDKEEVLQY